MSNAKKLETLAQTTFEDVQDDVYLPSGVYLFEVSKYKLDTEGGRDKDKEKVTLSLKAIEVEESDFNSEDLVNARTIFNDLWLHTEGARKFTFNAIADKIVPHVERDELKAMRFEDVFEALRGMTVRAAIVKNENEKGSVWYDVEYLRPTA